MNKFLQIIDIFTGAILIYVVVATLCLLLITLLDYITYNWLVALGPFLIAILALGVTNFEHDASSNVMI